MTGGVALHPAAGRSAGRVDCDLLIFLKEPNTVLIASWGCTYTAGHQPRECRNKWCGEREIVRGQEGFRMKMVEPPNNIRKF